MLDLQVGRQRKSPVKPGPRGRGKEKTEPEHQAQGPSAPARRVTFQPEVSPKAFAVGRVLCDCSG